MRTKTELSYSSGSSQEPGHGNRPKANSSSSRNTFSSTNTREINRAAHRDVRTLPPWIDSYEEGEKIIISNPPDRLLLPPQAHSAQHHFDPSAPNRRRSQDGYVDEYDDSTLGEKKTTTGFFGHTKEPVRGRKWDHARDGEPVILQSGVVSKSNPWLNFVRSSMYGPAANEDGEVVDEKFLEEQTPGYQKPWRGDLEAGEESEHLTGLIHSKKQRRTFMKRVQHILLMHPLVPLMFRVMVLTTSIIALGISASVHHLSDNYTYRQNPSTTMAIVVDVVAIPYILYVTWDEYTGKPLGLRSPKTKIRLVLVDLFFIIFESANLALAFGALTDDNGSCRKGENGANAIVCDRVKALCGILMVALIAWNLTFSVSIFRLVERVGGKEEGD